MSRARLTVQHFVAALEVNVVPPAGPNNFYDLLGVGYLHLVPPDAELPWSLPQIDTFARFVGGVGVAEVEVRVVWIDAPEGEREVDVYGPFTVAFRTADPVRDTMFRLRGVPLDGPGRYQFRLWHRADRRGRLLATEFITVGQVP